MEAWIATLPQTLSLPREGLLALFVLAFASATLLPLGSEGALATFHTLHPAWLGPAVLVVTAGNTLGGATGWWVGHGAQHLWAQGRRPRRGEQRALAWLRRFGPKACVFSWLPVVGDPLCVAAGWLKLPFWPCLGWIALGKLLRYLALAAMLWGLWPRA